MEATVPPIWVPLHVHSQYSVLDATCSVATLVEAAQADHMIALALTDHGNLHGAIEFYKACTGKGIQPILGCEVYVAPTSRFEKKKISSQTRTAHHLTLLVKNEVGFHNLCRLSSLGYLEGFYYHPRIDRQLLAQYHDGLICLSGCLASELSQAILHGQSATIEEILDWYLQVFGEDYFLEIQRHPTSDLELQQMEESWLRQQFLDHVVQEKKVEEALLDWSRKKGIPCVATNDSHYLLREDHEAHEVLLNVQSGEPVAHWERDAQDRPTHRVLNPKRRVYPSREYYFKTQQEMAQLFADLPDALHQSIEIAKRCSLNLDFQTKHYPLFIPPDQAPTESQPDAAIRYLRQLCEQGIDNRYTEARLNKVREKYPDQEPAVVVRNRLERELSIISKMAMADYLLIVWDFIRWAKQQGIPVGPGRGSGAGSIILYLIGVTDIEPLRFHLFFERFINPERFSYPDIDVDLCMEGREKVIRYTLDTYGKANVAQIITFGTMKAKMSVKDVGRAFSVPLSKVNAIAKLIPDDLQITLQKALDLDVELFELSQNDIEARTILQIGKKLEGCIRNTGIHAAGLIICADPLIDHIPLCDAKDSDLMATQYSMKPLEAVGMLKIDFLGLKTLTSIHLCVQSIEETTGNTVPWVDLPLEDIPTFQLLQEGRTLGVFQMESTGMQELAKQLKPDKFEEIIAIGALYRPGPMDMIPSFIQRKHGLEPIEYDHAWLEPILAETYGIMVYQEQVMQIAQNLAGYSLGQGDVLRRAMGKKDKEQMAKERDRFLHGAQEQGIALATAESIFDKMEKFAAYGFNKSHAAAYGYLTYVTAYLKANYPAAWLAALMTCDRDDTAKVAKFIHEGQAVGIPILAPDVNESAANFVATPNGIRFALTAVRGVGHGVVEAIVHERKARGLFHSFYDFFLRMDLKKIGKKPIEFLVDVGAFDWTKWSRDQLRQSIEPFYDQAAKKQKEQAVGIRTFFELMGNPLDPATQPPPIVTHPTPSSEMLIREKSLLGFFLSGHPLDGYLHSLERLSAVPLAQIHTLPHQTVVRATFLIESITTRLASKTQKKFAILQVSDSTYTCELPIWSDLYEQYYALLQENQLLYAVVQVDRREETTKLQCKWLTDLKTVNEESVRACDTAFDRAKMHIQRQTMFRKSTPPPTEKPMTDSKQILFMRMQEARLSHVLQVKTLLQRFPGSMPVEIRFLNGDGHLQGIVTIPKERGIRVTTEFWNEWDRIPSSHRET